LVALRSWFRVGNLFRFHARKLAQNFGFYSSGSLL
jgi:hypothetical protein